MTLSASAESSVFWLIPSICSSPRQVQISLVFWYLLLQLSADDSASRFRGKKSDRWYLETTYSLLKYPWHILIYLYGSLFCFTELIVSAAPASSGILAITSSLILQHLHLPPDNRTTLSPPGKKQLHLSRSLSPHVPLTTATSYSSSAHWRKVPTTPPFLPETVLCNRKFWHHFSFFPGTWLLC